MKRKPGIGNTHTFAVLVAWVRKWDLSDLLAVRQRPMMKAGWAVYNAGVWGERYDEVRPSSSLSLPGDVYSQWLDSG